MKKLSVIPIILSILLLTGCARQDKNILQNFEKRPFDVEQEKDNLKVGVKFLTKKEFNKVFKSPNLFKRWSIPKNYQAAQINISNKSNNNYSMNKNSINLNLVSHTQMEKKLSKNYALPTLAFFPTAFLIAYPAFYITTGIFFLFNLSFPGPIILGAILCIPIGIISALTFSILWGRSIHRKNKRLRKKLQQQVFDPNKENVINQNSDFETMIFMPKKDLLDQFSILLFDPLTQEMELEFLIPISPIQPCK